MKITYDSRLAKTVLEIINEMILPGHIDIIIIGNKVLSLLNNCFKLSVLTQ